MVTRSDYAEDAITAAHAVLIELTHLLAEYRDDVVLVGGWVPVLLLPNADEPHVGTTDIDLALNHTTLQEVGYESIKALLEKHGYYPHPEQPFIFFRAVPVGTRIIPVEVDFLAGEYAGSARGHRTQSVQDIRARKARGCDLAFKFYDEVVLTGPLPDGGDDRVTVRVASMVPFLVMKGMALRDRLKAKDAHDIYYCIRHYPGGSEALLAIFTPHLHHGLVIEGLHAIADKFFSPTAIGPKSVADFEEIINADDRELRQRDAFERIQTFLKRLGIMIEPT
jgi:hypothetical protein